MPSDSNFQGGTAGVKQIETFALQNDFNNSETALIMTMTAEDGTSTQTASIDPSGTDESTIAAAWLVALQASTDTLFLAVTWSVVTATITGTANIGGVPFFAASSVTGGAGTVSDSITTANAGPHAYGTAANHSPSGVPVADDIVYVVPHPTDNKSYDIKYDLNQSSIDYQEFRVPDLHFGSIGDSVNGFYFRADVSNISTGTPALILNGRGEAYWFKGVLDTVYVRRMINSKDAVHLAGGAIVTLYVTGPDNQGTLTVADSTNIANVYINNAPGANIKLGSSLSNLNILEMDSGNVLLESDMAGGSSTIDVNGGVLTIEEAAWTSGSIITVRAPGIVRFNVGGTLDRWNLKGGQFILDGNQSSGLTITNSTQWGGHLSSNSGLSNITWSNATIQHGGTSDGDVSITNVAV